MNNPRTYYGVMVSSTFTDLVEHRRKAIEAIETFGCRANVMESDGARSDVDVIESSLQMVLDSAGYILVISQKYGQTPVDPVRNPDGLSITELEFNEAVRLDRPTILLIMDDTHPGTKNSFESDPQKLIKLEAFRKRAKLKNPLDPSTQVERVYETFNSIEQFRDAIGAAVGRLIGHIEKKRTPVAPLEDANETTAMPKAPALCALPRYVGSHTFTGRRSELHTLTDWCGVPNQYPILLFEAIGGTGKSLLTWEWLTNHADLARKDWAGRFWYSFYEKGAVMSGFCRSALAYVTGKPESEFAKVPARELGEQLLAALQKRPWLLVLDGLERILVAYHSFDASQRRDDSIETAGDPAAERDPCDAVRAEDDILLRSLVAAAPSKIIITSRLTPRALLNKAHQPLPGVKRQSLPGLRPEDAEAMLRQAGVRGDSDRIRAYLQENCDCHPLVTGVLAGLINDYLPDAGNFDKWADDPRHGASLNLAKLDLVQRRNHIILTALNAIDAPSKKLLQSLALLNGSADYDVLRAINPYAPPKPEEVLDPGTNDDIPSFLPPEQQKRWRERRQKLREEREDYLNALAAWHSSPQLQEAILRLERTVRDLKARGLLQHDGKRFDLHPVVRGIVFGGMAGDETEALGQVVVDHLNSRPHRPWIQAQTLEDLAAGLEIVHVLLHMKRFDEAYLAYAGDLSEALYFNLEAYAEQLSIVRGFFKEGWEGPCSATDSGAWLYVLTDMAAVVMPNDQPIAEKILTHAMRIAIENDTSWYFVTLLAALCKCYGLTGRIRDATYLARMATTASDLISPEQRYTSRLFLYSCLVNMAKYDEAETIWNEMSEIGRGARRGGGAEVWRAAHMRYSGQLNAEHLRLAEEVALSERNREMVRYARSIRGIWLLDMGRTQEAIGDLSEALRMGREVGVQTTGDEVVVALAMLRLYGPDGIAEQAERASARADEHQYRTAQIWHELGERDRAIACALRFHAWAVADGEPYVHQFHLARCRTLLAELGADLPHVPTFDETTAKSFPWETSLSEAIERAKAKLEEDELATKSMIPAD